VSFPRYERYKDSGVEWLGEVPEHWEVRKLSQLFRAEKGKFAQMLTKEFCAENEGAYPVYSGQTENNGVMGSWDRFEFDAGTHGVLFSTTVGSGKVMSLQHLFGKFSLSQNCMVIRPTSDECVARFYYFHFQPLFDYERARIPQHMQASFRMEDLYSYRICVPPTVEEQFSIARFLDRETRKIDALVSSQRRLIELLKEKRQAVIAQAVTKGLNPHAPMKDSGVEWLGKLPAHWESVPLRFLVRSISGGTPDKKNLSYWEGSIPWVSPKDMKVASIADAEDHISEAALVESGLQLVPANHILIVVRGMILAHSFPVALTCADVTINQDMKALQCGKRLKAAFLLLVFHGLTSLIVSSADESAHGTKKLGSEVLGRLAIPLPPLAEQDEIVTQVNRDIEENNAISAEASRTIELLQERRNALISAAVTGKIDVRSQSDDSSGRSEREAARQLEAGVLVGAE
jgi:type I restriction enzyme, S subunit